MKIDLMDMQEYIARYRDEVTRIESEIDEHIEDYWQAEKEKDIVIELFILEKMKENGLMIEEDNEDDEFIDF